MELIKGKPRRVLLKDKLEGELLAPCSAVAVDFGITPEDFASVSKLQDTYLVTANRSGQAKLDATFVYEDGSTNTHSVDLFCAEPEVIPLPAVTITPKRLGGYIVDD